MTCHHLDIKGDHEDVETITRTYKVVAGIWGTFPSYPPATRPEQPVQTWHECERESCCLQQERLGQIGLWFYFRYSALSGSLDLLSILHSGSPAGQKEVPQCNKSHIPGPDPSACKRNDTLLEGGIFHPLCFTFCHSTRQRKRRITLLN